MYAMLVLANRREREWKNTRVKKRQGTDAFGWLISLRCMMLQIVIHASCFFLVLGCRDIDTDASSCRNPFSLTRFPTLSHSFLSLIFMTIVVIVFTVFALANIVIGDESIVVFIGDYVNT